MASRIRPEFRVCAARRKPGVISEYRATRDMHSKSAHSARPLRAHLLRAADTASVLFIAFSIPALTLTGSAALRHATGLIALMSFATCAACLSAYFVGRLVARVRELRQQGAAKERHLMQA